MQKVNQSLFINTTSFFKSSIRYLLHIIELIYICSKLLFIMEYLTRSGFLMNTKERFICFDRILTVLRCVKALRLAKDILHAGRNKPRLSSSKFLYGRK